MAADLWHRKPAPGEAPCTSCRDAAGPASNIHGQGKRYAAQWSEHDGTGKRRQLSRRYATRADAEAAEAGLVRPAHGMAGHPLYPTWANMMARCYKPDHHAYAAYGGRGVRVCERWHDPRVFIADILATIGPRPADPAGWHGARSCYSLDRWPDPDGDYRPGAVRWATWAQQHANKRPRLGVPEPPQSVQRDRGAA